MALSGLTRSSNVCIYHSRCHQLIPFLAADSVASEIGCTHLRSRDSTPKNIRTHYGSQVVIDVQHNERYFSTDCPSRTGMCAIHREIFGNQKLLYVDYSCILQVGLIFVIGRRLGKNIFSETATKISLYNSKLDELMQELRDRALVDLQSEARRIREDLSLGSLVCADGVGLNEEKMCLNGTRTEILTEIVDWICTTNASAPRIFWLHGQAGKGKSAIAHTIALQARNLGILGSCFCFTRVRQHEGLHTKLFPTIARDLANRDPRLRSLLAEVISNNPSLRDTTNVVKQWEGFIVEPLSQLEGSSTENILVVIDALDESGQESTREPILEAFATNDRNFPGNLRILLVSRPMVDISEALNAAVHVHVGSLDNINVESTLRDIRLYVSSRLVRGNFPEEDLFKLAAQSDGVFEWAHLACDFISQRDWVIAKRRMEEILSQAPGRGRTLLDEMYTTFLKEFVQGSSDMLARFQSVMRRILWLKKPLSINALDFMHDRLHQTDDHNTVGDFLCFMAPLLSGVTKTSTAIRPLHPSFYDFLMDEKQSGEFFIQPDGVHCELAITCLSIMHTSLHFNICGLETSYAPNAEIVDLDKRVEKNIPSYLLYACQFWATHLQDADDVGLAKLACQFITGEQILFWLEVLGVSKLIRDAYWALISIEKWFQVRCLL